MILVDGIQDQLSEDSDDDSSSNLIHNKVCELCDNLLHIGESFVKYECIS